MSKKTFLAIFILCAFFFIQCSSPTSETPDKNLTTDSTTVTTDSAKTAETSIRSEITCPKCGHKKMEEMPTDVCLLSYTCEKCSAVLHPKEGDCCVFCTYGTHKCPSIQEGS